MANHPTRSALSRIEGFTADADGRLWTADGAWGLERNDDSSVTLLDRDGAPSNHTLSASDAAFIIGRAGLGEDLMRRWDHYASANA